LLQFVGLLNFKIENHIKEKTERLNLFDLVYAHPLYASGFVGHTIHVNRWVATCAGLENWKNQQPRLGLWRLRKVQAAFDLLRFATPPLLISGMSLLCTPWPD
jgi:hypothetical protein